MRGVGACRTDGVGYLRDGLCSASGGVGVAGLQAGLDWVRGTGQGPFCGCKWWRHANRTVGRAWLNVLRVLIVVCPGRCRVICRVVQRVVALVWIGLRRLKSVWEHAILLLGLNCKGRSRLDVALWGLKLRLIYWSAPLSLRLTSMRQRNGVDVGMW